MLLLESLSVGSVNQSPSGGRLALSASRFRCVDTTNHVAGATIVLSRAVRSHCLGVDIAALTVDRDSHERGTQYCVGCSSSGAFECVSHGLSPVGVWLACPTQRCTSKNRARYCRGLDGGKKGVNCCSKIHYLVCGISLFAGLHDSDGHPKTVCSQSAIQSSSCRSRGRPRADVGLSC